MNELVDKVLDEFAAPGAFGGTRSWRPGASAWSCWLAVFAIAGPYRLSARVFVDTRTALDRYVKDLAIQQDVNAQINFVRQSLLSRPHSKS